MQTATDDESNYETYLKTCIGTTILAVEDDDDSIRMYLSDGSVVEFYAEADGGFGVEVYLEGLSH